MHKFINILILSVFLLESTGLKDSYALMPDTRKSIASIDKSLQSSSHPDAAWDRFDSHVQGPTNPYVNLASIKNRIANNDSLSDLKARSLLLKEIWHIVLAYNAVLKEGNTTWKRRMQLWDERNYWRERIWDIFTSRNAGRKKFEWKETVQEIGVDQKEFQEACYDYLLEKYKGDLKAIEEDAALEFEKEGLGVDIIGRIRQNKLVFKWYLVRALAKVEKKQELDKDERGAIIREFLEGDYQGDSTFPSFSYTTDLKATSELGYSYKVQFYSSRRGGKKYDLEMVEEIGHAFGSNVMVRVRSAFDETNYGWVFEVTKAENDSEDVKALYFRLNGEKSKLDLFDCTQQSFADAVAGEKNIYGDAVEPCEGLMDCLDARHGRMLIRAMARNNRFGDRGLILPPFRVTATVNYIEGEQKGGEFIFRDKDMSLEVKSVSLEAEAEYQVEFSFDEGRSSWVCAAYKVSIDGEVCETPSMAFRGVEEKGRTVLRAVDIVTIKEKNPEFLLAELKKTRRTDGGWLWGRVARKVGMKREELFKVVILHIAEKKNYDYSAIITEMGIERNQFIAYLRENGIDEELDEKRFGSVLGHEYAEIPLKRLRDPVALWRLVDYDRDSGGTLNWETVALRVGMQREDLIKSVVGYLVGECNDDYNEVAVRMKILEDTFVCDYVHPFGLLASVQGPGMQAEEFPGADSLISRIVNRDELGDLKGRELSLMQIWEIVLAYNAVLEGENIWERRMRLWEERNQWREKIWDDVKSRSRRHDKIILLKTAGDLGISTQELETVVCDYFLEKYKGEVERINAEDSRLSIEWRISQRALTPKWHLVCAVRKTSQGLDLNEKERYALMHEFLRNNSRLDSSFPAFCFSTITKRATAESDSARVYLMFTYAGKNLINLAMQQKVGKFFGVGVSVRVNMEFSGRHGWLFTMKAAERDERALYFALNENMAKMKLIESSGMQDVETNSKWAEEQEGSARGIRDEAVEHVTPGLESDDIDELQSLAEYLIQRIESLDMALREFDGRPSYPRVTTAQTAIQGYRDKLQDLLDRLRLCIGAVEEIIRRREEEIGRKVRLVEGKTLEAITREYLPRIRAIAGRLVKLGYISYIRLTMDDLVSAGSLGLIDAFNRFEAARGVPFKAYAEIRIRGAMMDGIREEDPAGRRRRKFKRRVAEVRRELWQKRIDCSDGEIARALGMALEDYQREAVDANITIDYSDDTFGECGDRVGGNLPSNWGLPSDSVEVGEMIGLIRDAISVLEQRRREAYQLHLQGKTLKSIGERFGVTESRVCQWIGEDEDRMLAYIRARTNIPEPERVQEVSEDECNVARVVEMLEQKKFRDPSFLPQSFVIRADERYRGRGCFIFGAERGMSVSSKYLKRDVEYRINFYFSKRMRQWVCLAYEVLKGEDDGLIADEPSMGFGFQSDGDTARLRTMDPKEIKVIVDEMEARPKAVKIKVSEKMELRKIGYLKTRLEASLEKGDEEEDKDDEDIQGSVENSDEESGSSIARSDKKPRKKVIKNTEDQGISV